MASNSSRPDPASPASVSAAQFPVTRRGFDQAEVGDFLRMVAAELARLQERERHLERELRAAQQARPAANAVIDEDTATRLLGEEAARVLQTAREAAAQIRLRAEEGSARLLREATDEAQRLREEAEIEAARRRQDAASDSESELQMAKQQGRDMVNEARAYRERVLSELARRRELARHQIEQLIHGRDRLLQAFERSRIAAVEVMAELTPLGEPSDFAGLQPTTGQVPLIPPAPYAAAATVVDRYGVDDIDAGPPASGGDETLAIDMILAEEADIPTGEQAAIVVVPADDHAQPDEVSLPDLPAERESEPEPEPEASPEPMTDLEPEPVPLSPPEPMTDLEPALVPVPSPEPDASAQIEVSMPPATDAADDEPSTAAGDTVDDLFAKLRAARAAAVLARAELHVSESASVVTSDPSAATEIDSESGPVDDPAADEPNVAVVDAHEVIVPLIVSASRKLKRVLADEQNDLLDALRRLDPVRNLDALLPWESAQSTRYVAAVEHDLITAATAGAEGSENGANPAIVRPAEDAITNEIVAPLRDRLIRCIDKAEGDNIELANQVRSLYREWKTHVIDEHVENIVRLAFDRGALTITSR